MLHAVIIRGPDETTGLPGLRTLLQGRNDSRRRTNERTNERTNAGTSSPPPITAGSPAITPGGVSDSMHVKIWWRTWQYQKEYISAVKYRLVVYHLPSDQRKLVEATARPFRARHVFGRRPSSVSQPPLTAFSRSLAWHAL